jgi:hypothetical protein
MHKLCRRQSKVRRAQPIVETEIYDDQPLPFLENSNREEALSTVIFPEADPSPINILDLPPEMHLEIFALLDHTASVCLGLTNKKFYGIYKTLHPIPHKLSITNCYSSQWTTAEPENPPLPFLLAKWMGSDLAFSCRRGKFINKERYEWAHFRWKQSVKGRAEWVEEIYELQLIGGEVRKYADLDLLRYINGYYTNPIARLHQHSKLPT